MENTELTFEDFGNENGNRYWLASDLMRFLDYPNMQSFKNVIDRATVAMSSIKNVDTYDEISKRDDGDYRLSRFACYMVTLKADGRKEAVSRAQAYFAHMAKELDVQLERHSYEVDRVSMRSKLTENNKSLQSAAKSAGVSGSLGYARFNDAGWIGMYNKRSGQIAKQRGISNIYDSMGSDELSAHIFRTAMTKARLKKDNVQGQFNAEQVHTEVAQDVRRDVKKNTGKNPEDLPQEALLIHTVETELKQIRKGFKKQDKGKLPPKEDGKK